MAAVHQTIACLRFFGDDLDPDHISKSLNARPTTAYRKGAAIDPEEGDAVLAQTGTWQLEADEELSGDLGAQLTALLAELTDDLAVWRDLSAQYDGDVLVGLFMADGKEGFYLEPALLSALGERGLVLDFELYGTEDDDAYHDDDA
ncbi:DUF4279 domain-containing protein [Neorhizobium sp. NPDC001467]|uniref:DUF4279 domain-containing protein n=1 Tax=Neorhizobium sp. NPDC001467 TaxID=3390595 RepID=UPI003D0631DE